jgi:hypothetical protein
MPFLCCRTCVRFRTRTQTPHVHDAQLTHMPTWLHRPSDMAHTAAAGEPAPESVADPLLAADPDGGHPARSLAGSASHLRQQCWR